MIAPVGADSFKDALMMGTDVYHTLKYILKKNKLKVNYIYIDMDKYEQNKKYLKNIRRSSTWQELKAQ